MGMPEIPDGKNRPSYHETIIDLLESIALEEMAIAHIMNAEGEKLQEITRRFGCHELHFPQLEDGCRSTHDMVNSLIMQEWLLLNKMNSILAIRPCYPQDMPTPPPCPPPCNTSPPSCDCLMREDYPHASTP